MPYKKRLSAQQISDATRGGQESCRQQRDAGGGSTERERLMTLRNSDVYKRWLSGWQGQESSMDAAYRGLDKTKGRISD